MNLIHAKIETERYLERKFKLKGLKHFMKECRRDTFKDFKDKFLRLYGNGLGISVRNTRTIAGRIKHISQKILLRK